MHGVPALLAYLLKVNKFPFPLYTTAPRHCSGSRFFERKVIHTWLT